jgi:hypothetical protein
MLAWSIANRGVYSDAVEPPLVPHMRWPPGYPLLLAPFYRGRDLVAGTAAALPVQVVASAAIPLLTLRLGVRLLPWPLAWLAALLAACCPLLVTTPAFPVSETAFTILVLGLLLALARLLDRPGAAAGAAAGLLGGAAILVRSSALALVGVAAAWVWLRVSRRAALCVLAVAAVPAIAWEVRFRVEAAHGTPAPSYLARPLAEGIYPDLVYADSARGYAMEADPEFPAFSTSVGDTLGTAWSRALADPWRHLRWHLVDRWLVLWEYGMIQSPPIHVYPVMHGLFRPAAIDPGAADEPLAPLYWMFRALWYWCIVPAALVGAAFALRRHAETQPGRLRELASVLLAVHVVLHGALIPEPRFLLPLRPLLFVLALAALADAAARLAVPVRGAVFGVVASIAAAGWGSAVLAAHRAPAARQAAAADLTSGRRLEAAGDVAGALAAYEAARAADPRNVDAAMLAGLLYHHHLGDPARAVDCYRDVLAARPDHYGAHYQLATALLAAGRPAEARAAWASFARLARAIGDQRTIDAAPDALRDASATP